MTPVIERGLGLHKLIRFVLSSSSLVDSSLNSTETDFVSLSIFFLGFSFTPSEEKVTSTSKETSSDTLRFVAFRFFLPPSSFAD